MINKAIIQGRLVRDVELRYTKSEKAVASFTLAWSEKFGDTEQKVFMPCVAWGKTGEMADRYFSKGQEAIAEGKLVSRKWKDKNGNDRETIELIVDRLHFCGPKKSEENQSYGQQTYGQQGGYSQPDNYSGYSQYSSYDGPQFSELQDPNEEGLPF